MINSVFAENAVIALEGVLIDFARSLELTRTPQRERKIPGGEK